MALHDLLAKSAQRGPDSLCVKTTDSSATYSEIDQLANQIARAFIRLEVKPGDRVGIWLEKSVATIAAMQASLRVGAAYVPLDPLAPQQRIETIMRDCKLKALLSSDKRANKLMQSDLENTACLTKTPNRQPI